MGPLKTGVVAVAFMAAITTLSAQEPQEPDSQPFRFRSGVDLINVTATVSDGSGRFVPGLTQDDFRVYEDGQLRPITHFTSERVPVSLGIVLDTSGSMEGPRMVAARQALLRFLFDLLGPEDEVFLYRFDNRPHRVHGWTTDRERIASEIRRIEPRGATTLYDAVAEALPFAATGRHRKKALLIISDGNDSSSYTSVGALKKLIRESEVLVYAIGIDAMRNRSRSRQPWFAPAQWEQRRGPRPFPFPIPGRGNPPMPPRGPIPPPWNPPPTILPGASAGDEPVNLGVLREITDDTGGRTEIIWQPGDLQSATAGIADELSRQYFLGYPAAAERDGKWHAIRLEVTNPTFVVRARRGYMATP